MTIPQITEEERLVALLNENTPHGDEIEVSPISMYGRLRNRILRPYTMMSIGILIVICFLSGLIICFSTWLLTRAPIVGL